MDSDKIPLEYKELIREFHPKRDQMNKIHRWRYTTVEDDVITKIIFIDGLKKGEQLEKAVFEKTAAHLNDDWTGMKPSVFYSMKKHQRWKLPNILENNLPSFEGGFRIPLPINGTSLARFENYRTHGYSPRGWGSLDLRYYCRRVMNLTVLDQEGEKKNYRPGINKGNIKDIIRTLNEEKVVSVPTIHVQFQTLEFKFVPRKHNSRKYDYNSGRCRYDYPPVWNALILNEELAFCSCCGECECRGSDIRDRYQLPPELFCYCHTNYESDLVWDSDGDSDDEHRQPELVEKCDYCKYQSLGAPLVFGDFFNVHNIPREKRCKKRDDLKDWVLL